MVRISNNSLRQGVASMETKQRQFASKKRSSVISIGFPSGLKPFPHFFQDGSALGLDLLIGPLLFPRGTMDQGTAPIPESERGRLAGEFPQATRQPFSGPLHLQFQTSQKSSQCRNATVDRDDWSWLFADKQWPKGLDRQKP